MIFTCNKNRYQKIFGMKPGKNITTYIRQLKREKRKGKKERQIIKVFLLGDKS